MFCVCLLWFINRPATDTMHHIDQAKVRLLVFLSPVYALTILVLIRDYYLLMCVALKLSYGIHICY